METVEINGKLYQQVPENGKYHCRKCAFYIKPIYGGHSCFDLERPRCVDIIFVEVKQTEGEKT